MVRIITKWTYLEPLLYSKEALHLEEISKKLKKNHSAVRQYLNDFEKQGILAKNIKGRLTTYKINLSNPLIIDFIAIVEKEKLVNRCKTDLLLNEIAGFLHAHLKEENKALIFGSSVLDSKKANDIDLLIAGKIDFEKDIKLFEKKFNLKIHLINSEDLKSLNDSLKKEIIQKHLIIQGCEEIVKWLI